LFFFFFLCNYVRLFYELFVFVENNFLNFVVCFLKPVILLFILLNSFYFFY